MRRCYSTCLLITLQAILFCQSLALYAQDLLSNNRSPIIQAKSNQLFWGLHTLSFIHNQEYFGPIVEGHTLVGHHIHPYFRYYPLENLQIDLGVFMRRDWADRHFLAKKYPTFTIQHQDKGIAFLLGNSQWIATHRLIKPLYHIERFLLRGPEPGLQLQYIQPNTFIDIWLEWLALLCQESGEPEELSAGISLEQTLWRASWIRLALPLQLVLYHLGGQGIPTQDYTLWLGTVGASMTFPFGEQAWLREISWETYYVANQYVKKVWRPFRNGQAFYNKLAFKTDWLLIIGSYWQGNGFSSENLGDPLYQSIRLINKSIKHQEKLRQLALLEFNYTYQLAVGLNINLSVTPYYDFQNKLLEHAEGLYLTYNPLFRLIEMKQP